MNWLIIVAGGKGERMNLGFNKIFAKLGNLPLLYWTLNAFEKSKTIDNIVISASLNDLKRIKTVVRRHRFNKTRGLIPAQHLRQISTFKVLETFKAQMANGDLVGVHNAVNPFVTEDEIHKVYKNAKLYGAALLAQAAKDTVKITNDNDLVEMTPPRQYSWYAQTPQVATFENLYRAHKRAHEDNFVGTDDAQLLEMIGIKPKIVPCSHMNFKITFREDLMIAAQILKTWTE